jgi:trans-aconitate methyltransferase
MTDNQPNGSRQAFDAAAADFETLGRHLWRPIGVATVAATAPRPGDRVLDACCGTGASAIPAARLVGRDGLVDAVDVSSPMVDELRLLSTALPQLRTHKADVTTWTIRDYDVVHCALGIFFLPDMTDGTDRLVNLTRPGGRVGFTIWRRGAMATAGRHLSRAVAQATNAPPPPERKTHLIDQISHADSYAAWLTQRGLSDVEVIVNDLRLPMNPELAWLVITGSRFRGALLHLSPEKVETVRELYLASLGDEGVTELDATTLIGVGTRAVR